MAAVTVGADGGLKLAGAPVSVVRAPRPRQPGVLGLVRNAVTSLLRGMRLTLSYLLRPSTVVTRQYPENRETLRMHDRYRAKLEFLYEDNGFYRCTSCRICERECPNDSIIIEAEKGPLTKKWELERYIWRLDTCTFCYICVQVCPFDAIDFTGKFESSVYDRRLLIYNLNNYAGPHASLAEKITDEEQRKTLRKPVEPYTGALPLTGVAMHGIPALPGAAPAPLPTDAANDEPNAGADSGAEDADGGGGERG